MKRTRIPINLAALRRHANSDPSPLSITRTAELADTTRQAVWGAVKALEEWGINVRTASPTSARANERYIDPLAFCDAYEQYRTRPRAPYKKRSRE